MIALKFLLGNSNTLGMDKQMWQTVLASLYCIFLIQVMIFMVLYVIRNFQLYLKH